MTRTGRPAIALAAALLLAAPGARAQQRKSVSFPVSFETADGFTLHGDLVSAGSAESPVAILLHMYRHDRTSWAPLVPVLADAGITVLALDQRAHGASTRRGEETVRVADIPRSQFGEVLRAGVQDVAAARDFLARRGMAVDRIALVGASYGCSVAILAANRVEGVKSLFLLSPGFAYFDVPVLSEAGRFNGPIFAVAAGDDEGPATAVYKLTRERPKPSDGTVYSTGGHGTRLFTTQPQVLERIRSFLVETLEPGRGPRSLRELRHEIAARVRSLLAAGGG